MANAYSQKQSAVALIVLLSPVLGLQLVNGLYLEFLINQSLILFWVIDVFTFVLLPLGLFFLLARIFEIKPDFFGLRNPIVQLGWEKFIVFSGISAIAYFYITYFVGKLAWQFLPTYAGGVGEGYSAAIPSGAIASFLCSIYFSLSAAVIETVVYTGVAFGLYNSLARSHCLLLPFAIMSGLLFGSIHWENGLNEVVTNSLLGGIAFLLLNWWGNIWPLVVGHFAVLMVIFL